MSWTSEEPFDSKQWQKFFLNCKPNQTGYHGIFSQGIKSLCVKLNTQLHRMSSLRISGDMPPKCIKRELYFSLCRYILILLYYDFLYSLFITAWQSLLHSVDWKPVRFLRMCCMAVLKINVWLLITVMIIPYITLSH